MRKTAARITKQLAFVSICLLVFILIASWGTSSWGQSNSPVGTKNPIGFVNPDTKIFHTGEIEYASVFLDGVPLFQVAAQRVPTSGQTVNLSPIRLRVQQIEANLYNVINTNFKSKTLQVTPAIINDLTVIIASDRHQLSQEVILTVTDLDAQIANQSIPDLAQQWSETIERALIRAKQSRQPEARKRQIEIATIIAIGMAIASLLFSRIQKLLKTRFDRLKDQFSSSTELKSTESQNSLSHSSPNKYKVLLSAFRKQSHLKQRLYINILLQQFLKIGQLLIWSIAIASILYQFPETRLKGRDIFDIPLQIFIIWFVLMLTNQFIFLYINQQIREWIEKASVLSEDSQRKMLRASNLSQVLQGIVRFTSWWVGLIWFLAWQQFPLSALITGAGLIGATLTFVFQNLLKDWINGILIIFEDQYAVGDVVDFGGGTSGFVEYMSLRSTKIRSAGGRLSTIPHNQITIVHNLTKDWSRVDFTIEVAYGSDTTLAMEIMKEVALEMARDPQWQNDILEPVNLIGVSRVAHAGIEISMWIKTKRMRQWDVEREFRRRLKLAFDEKGIGIGVPQQTLLLKNSSEGKLTKYNGQNKQEPFAKKEN
jgi:small conductance mechanosensitive channel